MLVSLQSHLSKFALHTGVQRPSTNASEHCSGQIAISTAHCCSAKQQVVCHYSHIYLMHWSCITAHLYEEKISIGVVAVAQGCCELVLQSSAEEWGQHFALDSAA